MAWLLYALACVAMLKSRQLPLGHSVGSLPTCFGCAAADAWSYS